MHATKSNSAATTKAKGIKEKSSENDEGSDEELNWNKLCVYRLLRGGISSISREA